MDKSFEIYIKYIYCKYFSLKITTICLNLEFKFKNKDILRLSGLSRS